MITRTSRIAFAAADKASGSNTKATDTKANTTADTNATATTAAASTTETTVATIRTDIPVPARAAGGRGGQSIYPFDQLEVGQSFGVKGKKSMASTVSSANGRFSQEITDPATGAKSKVQTKEFKQMKVDPANDPDNAEIRVWRIK